MLAMVSWRSGLVACLFVAVSAPAWAQSNRAGSPGTVTPPAPTAPPRDRQPAGGQQPVGTGSISGRVVSADGSALRRAQVQLSGPGVTGRTDLTDGEGRFS